MKKIIKPTGLKKRRIEMNMSQKDLADKVGVAISSIGGYERGENPLSEDIAEKLALALGCQKQQLFLAHKKLKNKWTAK